MAAEKFVNENGKEIFDIPYAKALAEKLNAVSMKLGIQYMVERHGMHTAKVRRTTTDGGSILKRKTPRRKKC